MDNFTKKRIKRPSEMLKDFKSGEFSPIKREFDMEKTKKTAQELSQDGKRIKEKIDQLKEVHHRLADKDSSEKQDYIRKRMPGRK